MLISGIFNATGQNPFHNGLMLHYLPTANLSETSLQDPPPILNRDGLRFGALLHRKLILHAKKPHGQGEKSLNNNNGSLNRRASHQGGLPLGTTL